MFLRKRPELTSKPSRKKWESTNLRVLQKTAGKIHTFLLEKGIRHNGIDVPVAKNKYSPYYE
jgi:hypothetical protein